MKFANLEVGTGYVFVDIRTSETELHQLSVIIEAIGAQMSFVAMPEDDGELITGCLVIEPKSASEVDPDPNATYFVIDNGLQEVETKIPIRLRLVKKEGKPT